MLTFCIADLHDIRPAQFPARRGGQAHARSAQCAPDALERHGGGVVFPAKVREDNLARAETRHLRGEGRRGIVRQVPQRAENPLLERIGVGPGAQTFLVVVALEHEKRRPGEHVRGLVRDEPRVRQNADGAARGVNAVVDAPRCVVRRLKRRDARRADGERREPLHLAEHRPDPRDAPGELARGGGGGVDGNPVALDERLQAGDVVAVLMGDEDGIDLRESNAELLERGLDAPGGDARVHEDARALRVDDQAVPLGAAGQSMYCNHVAVPSKMRVTKTKPAPAVSGRRWNFF